ncbi:MAG: hypothetical protein A2Y10_09685 [Planctomycetes bacterium GWF2_41_51]|nr:MAG: hypothetical protein A2Y10_09685 [Planctomycetes bacterium GWF2_41_51]HBG28256.1 hypothetical protein [Phycisphaerales bacterium]
MKTKNQNYFRGIFFIWVLCFFLLLAVYLLILRPAQQNSRLLEKRLAEKKQIYDMIIQTEQKQTMNLMRQELDNRKEGLNKYVIEPKKMSDLIFNISQIANEKKVDSFNIKGIETGKSSSSSKSKYITEDYIDVSFETSFINFASILNSLERNAPIVFIDKFSIIRGDDKPAAGKVKMNLAVFVSQKNISSLSGISENSKNKIAELEKVSQ